MTDLRLNYDRRLESPDEPTGADILRRYLALKAEEARIKEEMEALKPAVLDVITDEDGGTIESFMGHAFTVQQRVTYAYSDNVKKAEEEVAAIKQIERARGVATIKNTVAFPVVKAAK